MHNEKTYYATKKFWGLFVDGECVAVVVITNGSTNPPTIGYFNQSPKLFDHFTIQVKEVEVNPK